MVEGKATHGTFCVLAIAGEHKTDFASDDVIL